MIGIKPNNSARWSVLHTCSPWSPEPPLSPRTPWGPCRHTQSQSNYLKCKLRHTHYRIASTTLWARCSLHAARALKITTRDITTTAIIYYQFRALTGSPRGPCLPSGPAEPIGPGAPMLPSWPRGPGGPPSPCKWFDEWLSRHGNYENSHLLWIRMSRRVLSVPAVRTDPEQGGIESSSMIVITWFRRMGLYSLYWWPKVISNKLLLFTKVVPLCTT